MADLSDHLREQLTTALARYPVADELGHRFADAGHELYLVGGTVRDALGGRGASEHEDLDFATSAPPEETERLVRGWADAVWLTGARFGTISAQKHGAKLEITTFRADAYTRGSRHPEVVFASDVESDLSRRDFTVNAMAVRLPDRRFVDPFDGLVDLAQRVVRTPVAPEVSFADDPLRMVRLARFVAVLDAEADKEALRAATVMADRLDEISRERIRDELNRLLVSVAPRRGMDLLCDTGLADRFLPEVPALRMQHDPLHHHKDVYAHTMAVVDRCTRGDLTLRLAALLHDIGKPATREFHDDGRVSFHNHDVVGARLARRRLEALRYSKQVVEDVSSLVELHLRFHGYSDAAWSDSAVRRYVRDAKSPEQLVRLNRLTRADVTTRDRRKAQRLAAAMDDLERRIGRLAEQEELNKLRPPLDGNAIMSHLGLSPGPVVGKAYKMLLEARIERGPMAAEDAYALLDAWAAQQGISPAGG